MNIQQMMKQAKKIQEQMEQAKEALSQKEFLVKKQGITVTVLGNHHIKDINIDAALLDPDDKEIVQDIIILAINEANDLINEAYKLLESSNKPGAMF